MRLSALLDALPPHLAPQMSGSSDDDPIIRGVTYDSRDVSPGDLFVALRGESHDGHEYLTQALELGAAALLVEAVTEGLETRGSAYQRGQQHGEALRNRILTDC